MIDPLIRNNSAVSRIAQRRGDNGEKNVTGMCRIYANDKVAYITKQNVATRGGAHNRVICGRAPTDYEGMICGSGRHIAAELKTSGEHETALDFGSRGIRPEQVDALVQRGQGGAISVLLWYRGLTLGVCHWSAMLEHSQTRKSVPASAFRWLSPIAFDFLPVAVALDEEYRKGVGQ